MPVPELSYVLVEPAVDYQETPPVTTATAAAPPPPTTPARYTPSLLRQALQLMGAKPRQSDRAARKAFLLLQQRAALPAGEPLSLAARVAAPGGRAGVALSRAEFDSLVMDCLAAADHKQQQGGQAASETEAAAVGSDAVQPPSQQQQQQQHPNGAAGLHPSPAPMSALAPAPFTLEDLHVACALREQRASVAVLLCGTSGTGKSTLAALLAARLGITTVVSTDSIRHMLRSFSSEAEDPLLWASTYQAGAHLQALAAAAAPQGQPPLLGQQPLGLGFSSSAQRYGAAAAVSADPRKAAVQGYKAQSRRVLEHVDHLLTGCEARRQSVVLEGVHLSLSMVVRLMQRHPSVVPFLVHISNEAKHMERFAVRSKVMTLRAEGNRYVKHFRSIRTIQEYLVKSADKHAVPKVDNTNVDRSVATIHATVLGCLRRAARGESVLSAGSLSCKLLLEEYLRCQSATWSSSDMLELIRRKSAAGEAPSPSDIESAATATAAASTPRGPLSEAAGDEQAHLRPDTEQKGQAGLQGEEDEGDNRSFYISDSQSSSQDGDGSTSCSCSTSGSEAGSGEDEEGDERGGRPGGDPGQQQQQQQHEGDGVADGAAGPQRRRRHRHRHRQGRGSGGSGSCSGGSSTIGEIPAGPVPLRLRRRSEVGSVLEPEPHSDTEDAELVPAADLAPADINLLGGLQPGGRL